MWEFIKRKRAVQTMVIARPSHVEIVRGDDITQIPYADVVRVEGYKTDDFTVDTIWIQIDTAERSYFVNDYYAGFLDAVNDLAKHL